MNTPYQNPRLELIGRLAQPDAPRVFSPAALNDWLAQSGAELPRTTLVQALNHLAQVQVITPVRHGVYLNARAMPAARPEETLPFIRKSATVSLQSVLAEKGVLNNPVRPIMAVYAYTERHVAGDVAGAEGSVFRLLPVRPQWLPDEPNAWDGDAYQRHTAVRTDTPEKALVQWLALSQKATPALPPPSRQDLDLELLRADRLDRLAERMGVAELWHAWRDEAVVVRPRRRLGC